MSIDSDEDFLFPAISTPLLLAKASSIIPSPAFPLLLSNRAARPVPQFLLTTPRCDVGGCGKGYRICLVMSGSVGKLPQ
jgi:hypothetical protein